MLEHFKKYPVKKLELYLHAYIWLLTAYGITLLTLLSNLDYDNIIVTIYWVLGFPMLAIREALLLFLPDRFPEIILVLEGVILSILVRGISIIFGKRD